MKRFGVVRRKENFVRTLANVALTSVNIYLYVRVRVRVRVRVQMFPFTLPLSVLVSFHVYTR